MLILSRRPGDAILIDGGIRIVVLATDGGSVRLGIEGAGATKEAREWLKGLDARAGDGDGATPGAEGSDPDD
jgi:carbon storage regulator CsrA